MKALKQLCTPRKSVFDVSKRDTVLNLTHLTDDKISAAEFFEENSVTDGMRTLLIEAHRRLQGKSSQAVFKLTQAMGGGKTHNLIALGLLAKTPKLRPSILKDLPGAKELPPVRVVAFSGRETDIPNGIWGEVARQLGKEQAFKDYYQPLKAPGRSAWINLLKGEPTLILLDELPPYLDNAKSVSVGNSDLSKVTATALTNLFEAVAEADLSNVCVVITDLVGTYAEASAQIQGLLEQLQNEAQRHSMDLTPVQMNTDEFYQILRKRLFESLPSDGEIDKVAQEYAKAVREAKQMDITAQSPEQFAALIKTSYPFHPAIKDLYARFRENRGFQQTRALIRLMRIITSGLWKSGEADAKYLISVQDINLNDAETLSEIRQINPNLENAVAHDIAAQGKAVAEVMDQNLTGTDARDACRLLFMAFSASRTMSASSIATGQSRLTGHRRSPGRS
jgi:predicted AAA+ superfamily ATPase